MIVKNLIINKLKYYYMLLNKKNMRHIVVFTGLLVAVVFLGMGCAPMPAFQASAEKTNAPATINFTNQSKKALTYEWNFGDGTYSAEPSPSHSYLTSGSYTVTLKARKGNKEQQFSKTITIEPPVECLIKLETEYGNIVIRLSNATPKHRDNFIKLVEEGYYNDLLFHRVIKNFMIQGGDPNSRNARPNVQLGVGGPGYTVPAELIDSLVHIKGALAAARQGDAVNPTKASSGSQFYIVQGNKLTDAMLNQIEERGGFKYSQAQREAYLQHGGTPFLDRQYTVFGQVIEGLDVIDKIAAAPTQPGDRPVKDIKMKLSVMK